MIIIVYEEFYVVSFLESVYFFISTPISPTCLIYPILTEELLFVLSITSLSAWIHIRTYLSIFISQHYVFCSVLIFQDGSFWWFYPFVLHNLCFVLLDCWVFLLDYDFHLIVQDFLFGIFSTFSQDLYFLAWEDELIRLISFFPSQFK